MNVRNLLIVGLGCQLIMLVTSSPFSKREVSGNTGGDSRECPEGYELNPHKNTCLRMVRVYKTWTAASNYCREAGEYLASFNNVESISWFDHILRTTDWRSINGLWTSGKREGGRWYWHGETDSEFRVSNWADVEPTGDGNCVMVMGAETFSPEYKHRAYKWNDISCDTGRGFNFVCEKF